MQDRNRENVQALQAEAASTNREKMTAVYLTFEQLRYNTVVDLNPFAIVQPTLALIPGSPGGSSVKRS